MIKRKVKVSLLILVLLLMISGLLLIILPYLGTKLSGTSFAGIMLLLSATIIFSGHYRLGILLGKFFDRLVYYFKNEDRLYFYFFLATLISAVAFRLIYITKPINYSEASIYLSYIENKTFHDLFAYTSIDNFTLNNIAIKLSCAIFGSNILALRLPSLFAGIALIPVCYATARLFYNKTSALMFAAVVAASPLLIYYSTDARGISLLMLLFFVLLILAKYLKDNNDSIVWIIFSVVAALGFFTSPLFILAFITVLLWIILSVVFKDSAYGLPEIAKRCGTVLAATFIFTFLFYIPAIISTGIKNIINFNFSRADSIYHSFYSSFTSIEDSWFKGAGNLNISLLILLCITVVISLIIHRKYKKHKICLIYPMAAAVLTFLLLKVLLISEQTYAFVLPVLFMVACAAVAYMVELVGSKIASGKKSGSLKWIIPSTSILLLAVIFAFSFFAGSVENINNQYSFKDYQKLADDCRDIITDKNRIICPKPSDILLQYYLSKKNMALEQDNTDVPQQNIVIIVNKSLDQNLEQIIFSNYNTENINDIGFSKPQVLFDYDTVTVFNSQNLELENNIIFDLDASSESAGTLVEGFKLSTASGILELAMDSDYGKSLKYFQVPINIENDTNYLVTFKIKQNIKMDNRVSFDFFGDAYDKPQQEFYLEPSSIKDDEFTPVGRIINSGNLNDDIEVFFRIFSYSSGQFIIRNLKIYKISD